MEKGFTGFKVKTGFGVSSDIKYLLYRVKEAAGDDVAIMADANCAYNSAAARRILFECEAMKLHFFEEPLPPEDTQAIRIMFEG